MDFGLSSLAEHLSAFANSAKAIGVDPVLAGAGVVVVMLMVLTVQRALRRRSATAFPHRAATRSPQSLIDERFDALRLETEHLNSLAPPKRHFKDPEKPSVKLRRR